MCFCSFVYHFSAATQHRTSIKIRFSSPTPPSPAYTQWLRSISRLFSSSSRFHTKSAARFQWSPSCASLSLSCSPSNAAAAAVSGLHLGAVVAFGIPGKDSILYVCVWESLYVCKRSYLRHLLFAQFVPPLVPPAYLAR